MKQTQEVGGIYLSVIIPAYNESGRISLTLIDIDKHLSTAPFSYEIIVVDNNSSDNTKDVVNRFVPIIKNLRVIDCKTQGKGAAVKKGMLEAKGDIRLFTDADNSTSVDHFFKMKHFFSEGYDVVIASRDIVGSVMEPAQPWYRRLLGDMGNIFIQAMVLRGIRDTQCGFKAFTKNSALNVFPLSTIVGWGFDVEILTLAKENGYKIKEIPVRWVNNPFSRVGAGAYINVLLEVVKVKIRILTGYYKKLSKHVFAK